MGQRQQHSGGESAPAPDGRVSRAAARSAGVTDAGLDGDPIPYRDRAIRERDATNESTRAATGRRPFALSFTAWLALNQLGPF